MTRAPSSTSPRRARAGASCSSRSACATSCCCRAPTKTPKRSKRTRPGELPAAYVERVTRAKLRAARRAPGARAACPPAPILCADTTVALGRRILGKPADAADARRACCALLSGRTHRVITAVAVARGRRIRARRQRLARALRADAARARSSATSPAASRSARPAPTRSRARAAAWIERIEGSYSGIMGLPLFETAALLEWAGVDCPALVARRKSPTSMQDILINWAPQETRVAVVENGAVQELHVERTLERGLVGNIYAGKVARVLPGMQSAFIDIGLERAAFLHVADVQVNGGTPRGDADARRARVPPHADRAPGVRGPDADRAGDQGPDRHQGRAAVDADQHRRAAARVPAAGRPHRHLAEDRLARAARAAARAHDALLAADARGRAAPSAAASSCAPTPRRRATPSWPTTSPTCARPGRAVRERSLQVAARHACCTRT